MKDLWAKTKDWWHWLWHDESWQAWLLNVALAFVLIKFVIYPLAGALMGTSLPVVAVVSGSMQHDAQNGMMCGQSVSEDAQWWATCGEYYQERGINKSAFEAYPFASGFNKGDIMAVRGTPAQDIQVGDVIVYQANKQYPIIHRVIDARYEDGELLFTTKGDHNPRSIQEYALANGDYYYRCYRSSGSTLVGAPCAIGQPVTAQTPGAVAVLDETRVRPDQVIGTAAARIPYLGYVKILFVNLLATLGLDSVAQIF